MIGKREKNRKIICSGKNGFQSWRETPSLDKLMAHPPKGTAVQTIEALSRSVDQQWIVAGLGPCANENEVFQRAIRVLKQVKPTPKGLAKAAEALSRSQLPLTLDNTSTKREARMRATAVKIYRTEHRRVSRAVGSGKSKLPEDSRQTSTLAWEKTQTQLLQKLGIKAPDLWKYEIFPSVEK